MVYEQRAARLAHFFSYIPFSRGYLLTGSVAAGTAHMGSDIDIIAISHPEFVWFHRGMLFVALSLTGLRRTRTKRAGRMCVNASYASTNNAPNHSRTLLLWGGASPLRLVEHLLCATGVAWLCERIARASISRFITTSFSCHLAHPDTVLTMDAREIEYYPPRETASSLHS